MFSVGRYEIVLHPENTAGKKPEEGEDDVKFHGPYELGYTHVTMATTEGSNDESRSKAEKVALVRIVGCNSPT